jgi:mono/diheme cytochrome c family protein
MRPILIVAATLSAALLLACSPGRKSAAGFHLPDGDPVKGQAVFTSLRCHACHSVAGVDLPRPVVHPPVPVELGGEVPRARTDGELVTAIIAPSHRLEPGYRRQEMVSGSLSRMGDFTEAMTARELIDLVAFLQSRYTVVPPPPQMK